MLDAWKFQPAMKGMENSTQAVLDTSQEVSSTIAGDVPVSDDVKANWYIS